MPSIAIDQINIGSNRRSIKDQKVAELMESIKANGLLNPITLDQNLNLIAGLHRLTACKLLGLDRIECNILPYTDTNRARLAEIDENLIRSELDTLERDELWLERDQILERLGLRAQPGDNKYTQRGEIISPRPKTTLELAKEAGYTDRTFQHGKQIARSIVPEVKEVIRGTPIAKSTTALLKVARAGSKERQRAEQAEKAAQEAKARLEQKEAELQAELAVEARARQKELQLRALQSATAEREAKLAVKIERAVQQQQGKPAASGSIQTQVGDEWILERHLLYCGDTASEEFINLLPSDAALAIASPAAGWNHDYLVNEARIVVVLREEGYIQQFCARHHMPFRFELMIGNIYVGVFSHQPISKPQRPIGIEGIEGIVAYLVSLYTSRNSFVIAPCLGHGEILISCERTGRICFAGEESPEIVNRAIVRWQNWTKNQAQKTKPSS